MRGLKRLNSLAWRIAMGIASASLAVLLAVVIYGVVLRYGFNDAPAYVEQVALLLVLSVAMFGAAAGVRDAGHIGLDSLVVRLPASLQRLCALLVHILVLGFALALLVGGARMAASTAGSTIPTLGISEAFRYLPVLMAGLMIAAFSLEHGLQHLLRRGE